MKPLLASGTVWHERRSPGRHAFSYRMAWLWCDVDALDRGEGARPWISPGPGGLLQIRREDHLQGTSGRWREGIESWLEKAGLPTAPRIHLLTLPRVLGRTFNPVGFWIGRGEAGEVLWMVAEVDNTFGSRHLYLLDARDLSDGELAWIRPKAFFVSPFHGVEGEYDFRLRLGEREILLRIDLDRHGEVRFSTGMRMDLSNLSVWRAPLQLAALAVSVVLVVPRILWQAARLHFTGAARLRSRPEDTDPWTVRRGKPVLLQRLVANRAMGRLWAGLGRITARETTNIPRNRPWKWNSP